MNSRATSVTGFVQLLKAAKGNANNNNNNNNSSSSAKNTKPRSILPDSVCFEILGIILSFFTFYLFINYWNRIFKKKFDTTSRSEGKIIRRPL